MSTTSLYFRALWQILRFEYCLFRGDFALLYVKVHAGLQAPTRSIPHTTEEICKAVDLVCVWYPKRVLCLQRSAATACLLKRFGMPASMVIGVQRLPFKAHAWVEVAGCVVNDKAYMPEIYMVLDRC
jgi:Transglutaminase-like superfamily